MSDDSEKLRATLDELQTELAGVEHDDPEVRELLRSALAEIQQTLEGSTAASTEQGAEESIADRLGSAASHYEDTHPNVSGILGGLIDALSRMGI